MNQWGSDWEDCVHDQEEDEPPRGTQQEERSVDMMEEYIRREDERYRWKTLWLAIAFVAIVILLSVLHQYLK